MEVTGGRNAVPASASGSEEGSEEMLAGLADDVEGGDADDMAEAAADGAGESGTEIAEAVPELVEGARSPAGSSEMLSVTGGEDEDPIHSVYVVLPEGFEGIPIDMIFDDAVQSRILDTCRRSVGHDLFRRLWPRGRRDLLDAIRRGMEESGRGPVAHGLHLAQARALAARLTEFVTAEVGVDREAAARAQGGGGASGGGGGGGDAEADTADSNARVHSVYFVLPADMQGIYEYVLPDILPRMVDVCRRHREFAMSWPAGPSEMERTLRQGVEESGRGPLMHGMRKPQAEALRDHLAEFVKLEVVVDREAAAKIQERERRNRPPPRPPPTALLNRFLPGAQVRVAMPEQKDEGTEQNDNEADKGSERLQADPRKCWGAEGIVTAYVPLEGSCSWSVRVTCTLPSGKSTHDWSADELKLVEPKDAETGAKSDVENSVVHEEALLISNEDVLVGDSVVFHCEGNWRAGRIVGTAEDDMFSIEPNDGQGPENVARRQIQTVLALELPPEPLAVGAVVRIMEDEAEARRLQRSRWNEELRPCLGQLGAVVEVREHHRVVVYSPATASTATWSAACLKQDSSEGLLCLDVHEHPMWWCGRLRGRICKRCGKEDLEEAYCCLQAPNSSDRHCVCKDCAVPYLEKREEPRLITRHHLCPLARVALPRGLGESRWPCAGGGLPGGCRGLAKAKAGGAAKCPTADTASHVGADQPQPFESAVCCPESEFLLCSACLEDPTLGESTASTRAKDVEDLPASAPRIMSALRAHPSEVFSLVEAGLFERMASALAGSDAAARAVAFDLGTWLTASAPTRADVGPALIDVGGGICAEAQVISEDCTGFDGTWTDEKEPGKWVRAIEGDTIYPPVAGAEARADCIIEVSGCGMPEFNGQYLPDGSKNGRTKYRKVGGSVQTCNYSDGSWYLCHDHSGSWYESAADTNMPPASGWVVGERGKAPAPKSVARVSRGAEASREPQKRHFGHMPSVGTWLLPIQVDGEGHTADVSGAQSVAEAGLDGIWLREASGDHIVISGASLTWPDGGVTPLCPNGKGRFTINLRGKVYGATLEEQGPRLVWSDGDVWTLILDTAAPAESPEGPPPQEGQPVKFRGFAGCIIKQVLSKRKVLIHIPGVGDQEVSTGDYSLQQDGSPSGSDLPVGDGPDGGGGVRAARLERLSTDAFSVDLSGVPHCAQLTDDGRLVWAHGGNAWVRMAQCPRCPTGHLLRRTRHTAPWRCRECSERISERLRLRCVGCDYDICDACVAIRNWEQASEDKGKGVPHPTCPTPDSPVDGAAGAASSAAAPDAQIQLGAVDALWRYISPTNNPIGIRTVPRIDGPRDGQMQHGQVFRVSEHRRGQEGVLFLRLADGRGWVFDKKPGVGMMCAMLRSREAKECGGMGLCTVEWAEAGMEATAVHGAADSRCPRVQLAKMRPALAAAGPRTATGDFLRAELLRELRRGKQCERRRVMVLLEGRANLLGVEGGEDVLDVALRSGCGPGVLEALLLAHVPVAAHYVPAPRTVTRASSGQQQQTGPMERPLQRLLALEEPRLASILAERGGDLAKAAAESMERLAARLCDDPAACSADGQGAEAADPAAHAARVEAARSCAAAARRQAEASRARGCIAELLRHFGRALLTPLLDLDGGDLFLEPSSSLGTLFRALGGVGYELLPDQADRLADAVAVRLAEERDEAIMSLISFITFLCDVFSREGEGNASSLSTLRAAFRRHGITACVQRFSEYGAGSPYLRSVDVDADTLQTAVEALVRRLNNPPEAGDVEVNPVADVVSKLPEKDALEKLITMLRDGSCTPYELGLHDVPRKILAMFESPKSNCPWINPAPVDDDAMALLASKLQVLLGMSEAFPVSALSVPGEGLDCLLRPHVLVLEGSTGRKELRVEPLLPLVDLERFVLHTVPIEDAGYLEWCKSLVGQRIAERPRWTEAPWQAAIVLAFAVESGLPVHTVFHEATGNEVRLLLHVRAVVVLGPAPNPPEATSPEAVPAVPSYSAGCHVQARFKDGTWCRATVEAEVSDGAFRIRWENGTQTDTVKRPDEMRPLPGTGKPLCQRVQVTQDGGSLAGIAIWEHASGAQDVVDQSGRFLSNVPRGSVVPESRHSRDSSGRPMPFEIRNLAVPEHERAPLAPSLERCFSAVDRDYRPRDFQYKNPARKIGGPDGEPLQQGASADDQSPGTLCLFEDIAGGKPAPKLRVLFLRARRNDSSQVQSPAPPGSSSASSSPSKPSSPMKKSSKEEDDEDERPLCPLSSDSTVLQSLLHLNPNGCAELPHGLRLRYEVHVESEDDGSPGNLRTRVMPSLRDCWIEDGNIDSGGEVAEVVPVLALLKRLRLLLMREEVSTAGDRKSNDDASDQQDEVRWESGPLNRKLADQLAQPLLTAAVAAPKWVFALPLAYPFLFEREVREQLLRCLGFGTSHAVLWMQRRSIEERYGDRLRRVEGQLEGRMDLTEHIVSDPQVFIGPARSDLVTLPSRANLLSDAERVAELTNASKATLEVKFADEGGFGDGVTQSFYTDVASELIAADREGAGLWAEHSPDSIMEYRGRRFLSSRRGLFPRACEPASELSQFACQKLRVLGRLMAKALRDGFVVPLPLSVAFFAAVLDEELPLAALPSPGDGCTGEFVGAAARFAEVLRQRHKDLKDEELADARQQEAERPGWGEDFLHLKDGEARSWSFNQYCASCCITFCETGLGGHELCDGGGNRALDVTNLDEFVELAASWLLRDGIAPQVAAFRKGVEDVCSSSAVWAFEADELRSLFCGSHVDWTREELLLHLRPRPGVEPQDLEMLADVLTKMPPARRSRFLEFVTACPRLPPGGLAAAEITVAPAQPAGSLPRARTCTKELRLPKYQSAEQLEERLAWAVNDAEGLYDDDRMG